MSDVATNPTLGERASARVSSAAREVGDTLTDSGSRERLGAVDWLRLFAIAAVAYYHTYTIWYPESIVGPYAFAGLHALTAASVYFAALSRSAKSDRDIIVKRANRLLVPWLTFSLVFMALAARSGKFQPWMIWTGGSLHLWFLPFVFVVSCAIAMARRRGWIVRGWPQAIAWSLLAIAGMVFEPHVGQHVPPVKPLWQVVNALPSVAAGMAIFTLPAGMTFAIAQLLVFALAGVVAQMSEPQSPIVWSAAAAAGSVVFGICRLLPVTATAASSFVGRTSFGIYLVHMAMLAIVVRVLAKLAAPASLNAQGAIASDDVGLIIAAQVTIAVVLCMAAVAVAERTPLRRLIG